MTFFNNVGGFPLGENNVIIILMAFLFDYMLFSLANSKYIKLGANSLHNEFIKRICFRSL